MIDLDAVYARTRAGLNEIRTRSLALTAEQRNLLIISDGREPLSSLARMFGMNAAQMAKVVEPLVEQGLLVPFAPATRARAGSPEEAAARLTELARELFGARASAIVQKIERGKGSWSELGAAVESSAKLARLTIDETRAAEFLRRSHEVVRLGS